ncbi:hypothetical protein QBC34DRAFT_420866 [Podospora aff. communis PSN243]|uniref:Uncharacterized protein n=1 Tax=Podospora aff. communis PSN243 TaxID=3040156 RepID=A0AAV9H5F8_9PEZI|nr:hypothetical protein QBC34DRAFT_420866 [Podospora aff. communis PSN243]
MSDRLHLVFLFVLRLLQLLAPIACSSGEFEILSPTSKSSPSMPTTYLSKPSKFHISSASTFVGSIARSTEQNLETLTPSPKCNSKNHKYPEGNIWNNFTVNCTAGKRQTQGSL